MTTDDTADPNLGRDYHAELVADAAGAIATDPGGVTLDLGNLTDDDLRRIADRRCEPGEELGGHHIVSDPDVDVTIVCRRRTNRSHS